MEEKTTKKRGARSQVNHVDEVMDITIVEETEKPKEEIKQPEKKEVTKPTRVKLDPDELIECRSITVGKLLLIGKKTKIQYRWENTNDIQYVEYQDLLAEMLTNADIVFSPYILIEDDRVLNDSRWKRITDLYERIVDNNEIELLLTMSADKFRRVLSEAPKGIQKAVKTAVATKIANGTFDSLQKVRIIDEICHTDLTCLISK